MLVLWVVQCVKVFVLCSVCTMYVGFRKFVYVNDHCVFC